MKATRLLSYALLCGSFALSAMEMEHEKKPGNKQVTDLLLQIYEQENPKDTLVQFLLAEGADLSLALDTEINQQDARYENYTKVIRLLTQKATDAEKKAALTKIIYAKKWHLMEVLQEENVTFNEQEIENLRAQGIDLTFQIKSEYTYNWMKQQLTSSKEAVTSFGNSATNYLSTLMASSDAVPSDDEQGKYPPHSDLPLVVVEEEEGAAPDRAPYPALREKNDANKVCSKPHALMAGVQIQNALPSFD